MAAYRPCCQPTSRCFALPLTAFLSLSGKPWVQFLESVGTSHGASRSLCPASIGWSPASQKSASWPRPPARRPSARSAQASAKHCITGSRTPSSTLPPVGASSSVWFRAGPALCSFGAERRPAPCARIMDALFCATQLQRPQMNLRCASSRGLETRVPGRELRLPCASCAPAEHRNRRASPGRPARPAARRRHARPALAVRADFYGSQLPTGGSGLVHRTW